MAEHCRNIAEIVQYLVLIYSTDSWEIFSFVLLKKKMYFFFPCINRDGYTSQFNFSIIPEKL